MVQSVNPAPTADRHGSVVNPPAGDKQGYDDSITVRKNSPLTEWKIQVDNRGGETPAKDQRVYRVAFPVLEGLRIGDRHETNYLARPYAQGELIPDPASYAFTRPKSSVPINVLTYIGWASMAWPQQVAKGVLLLPLARPRPGRRGGTDPRGPRRARGWRTYRLLPQYLDLGLRDGEAPCTSSTHVIPH